MVLPAIGLGLGLLGAGMNAYGERQGNKAMRGVTLEELARQREFDQAISAEIDRLTATPLMDPGLVEQVAGEGTAPVATAGIEGGGGRGRATMRRGKRAGRRAGVLEALAAHDLAGRGATGNAMIENLLAKNSMQAMESELGNAAQAGSQARMWGNVLSFLGPLTGGLDTGGSDEWDTVGNKKLKNKNMSR